ncbi:MAG: DUF3108 domain-containing protein [bacterium]|nr:DUF3108 domain-containing protein [bacterium]
MLRSHESTGGPGRGSAVTAALVVAGWIALVAPVCTGSAGGARADTLPAAAPVDAAPPTVETAERTVAARCVYGPGERLVFEISYGPVNAGEGTLEVVGTVEHGGRTCYHVESTANSNRFFSSIYKVRDKIVTYIDSTDFSSAYFYKRLREGDYKKTVEISFDRELGVAKYGDGHVMPVPVGVQDELSAFYFVRNLDLEVGRDLVLPAHTSRRNYEMKVVVHRRETVSVPAGRFDCFVVEPVLEGEGLFKHEGRITLYISADDRRVPVLMKTKVPVGTIDVALKEYRAGLPPAER